MFYKSSLYQRGLRAGAAGMLNQQRFHFRLLTGSFYTPGYIQRALHKILKHSSVSPSYSISERGALCEAMDQNNQKSLEGT